MKQRIWISVWLLLSVAITVGVFVLPEWNDPPAFLVGIGRLHPMVVHLPIGFLLFAFIILLGDRFGLWSELDKAFLVAVVLGGIFAWVATVLGSWLSLTGEYSSDLVGWHKIAALGVGWGAWIVFFLHQNISWRKWRLFAFIPLSVFIVVAGHLGGSLTHGEDYLQDSFSAVWSGELPGNPTLDVLHPDSLDLVYADLVFPVLERRCVGCHGPEKQKGDLRLDSFEAILDGGESGNVLHSQDPEQSELFIRVTLPTSDDDRMPPDGKKPLDDAEIRLLRWWIESGADLNMAWSDSTAPDHIKEYVTVLTNPDSKDEGNGESLVDIKIDPVLERRIEKIGMTVVPLAANKRMWQVGFTNVPVDSVEAGMALLASFRDEIYSVDLAGKNVSENIMKELGSMKGLVRLYLQKTNITDQLLEQLGNLENLGYLNLFGTQITEKSLGGLEKLPSLNQLYIWNTEISAEAATSVELRRQHLRIVADPAIVSSNTD